MWQVPRRWRRAYLLAIPCILGVVLFLTRPWSRSTPTAAELVTPAPEAAVQTFRVPKAVVTPIAPAAASTVSDREVARSTIPPTVVPTPIPEATKADPSDIFSQQQQQQQLYEEVRPHWDAYIDAQNGILSLVHGDADAPAQVGDLPLEAIYAQQMHAARDEIERIELPSIGV